jgi:hypothetical protein
MTRNGKIARLPVDIRQQINKRLYEGQEARQVIQWLNALPEVQAVLAAEFKGEPILPCNLSRWKCGGYQCWLEEQNAREAAAVLIEQSDGFQELANKGLASHISAILTANLLVELKRLDSCREGPKKTRRQRDLLERFVALQRGSIDEKRLRLEGRRMDFQKLRFEAKKHRIPPSSAQT